MKDITHETDTKSEADIIYHTSNIKRDNTNVTKATRQPSINMDKATIKPYIMHGYLNSETYGEFI